MKNVYQTKHIEAILTNDGAGVYTMVVSGHPRSVGDIVFDPEYDTKPGFEPLDLDDDLSIDTDIMKEIIEIMESIERDNQ